MAARDDVKFPDLLPALLKKTGCVTLSPEFKATDIRLMVVVGPYVKKPAAMHPWGSLFAAPSKTPLSLDLHTHWSLELVSQEQEELHCALEKQQHHCHRFLALFGNSWL